MRLLIIAHFCSRVYQRSLLILRLLFQSSLFSFSPFKNCVKILVRRQTPLEDSASGPLLPLGFLRRRPLVDLPNEVVENLQGKRRGGN